MLVFSPSERWWMVEVPVVEVLVSSAPDVVMSAPVVEVLVVCGSEVEVLAMPRSGSVIRAIGFI